MHAEGITEEECTRAAEFLVHRNEHILEMIRASKERMANIKQW
jgi:hypothetical protein